MWNLVSNVYNMNPMSHGRQQMALGGFSLSSSLSFHRSGTELKTPPEAIVAVR